MGYWVMPTFADALMDINFMEFRRKIVCLLEAENKQSSHLVVVM